MWRAKSGSDGDQGTSTMPVNMVFVLLRDFMAPADSDDESEDEEGAAQLNLEPTPTTFEKPEEEK